MVSNDCIRLLESIVRCGRRNNKMFDYASITLKYLNSPYNNKRYIGEQLSKFNNPYNNKRYIGEQLSKFNNPYTNNLLLESRYSRWLSEPYLVKEAAGYGVAVKMYGKEYRYIKEDMTAEELLETINKLWDEKGPGAVGQFLRKECFCYLGSKNDSVEGRVRAGWSGK